MAIKKQEFYEGAALHRLARRGAITSIRYDAPFFILNDRLLVYLKYCTKTRSPWGFTFTKEQQATLQTSASNQRIIIGLICGADGVVAVAYEDYVQIAAPRSSTVHVACYRKHGKHYDLNGPDGALDRKIAPSIWPNVLNGGGR